MISMLCTSAGGRVIASPYAKKLAAGAGVSLAGVSGTGPHGRIVADDVRQLLSGQGAAPAAAAGAPAPEGGYTDVQVRAWKPKALSRPEL